VTRDERDMLRGVAWKINRSFTVTSCKKPYWYQYEPNANEVLYASNTLNQLTETLDS
jgi:hypothetical protein